MKTATLIDDGFYRRRALLSLEQAKAHYPLPDELEAIKKANENISKYGTVSHESINWD